MDIRNKLEVRISGRTYTLVGEESEEYLQKVSRYVDKKLSAISKLNSSMSLEMASVLTAINVADDLFKSLNKEIILSNKLNEMQKEIEILQREKEALLANNQSLDVSNRDMTLEITKVSEANKRLEQSLKDDSEKLRVIMQDNKRLFNENAEMKAENKALKNDIEKIKKELVEYPYSYKSHKKLG